MEKAAISDCFILSYKHQPYCWQVALQQSLLPLQIDDANKVILTYKITNYFSVHYLNKMTRPVKAGRVIFTIVKLYFIVTFCVKRSLF
jgi:hypothetical protein